MKIASKVFLLLVICIGIVIACRTAFPSGTWRYRMTVTVETPEGIKTGSAVREVHVTRGWLLTPEMLPDVTLKGEAVVVDLGQRGVLFALLCGGRLGDDYGSDIPFYVFRYPAGGLSKEGIKHFSKLKAGPVELQPENYPMFVRFRDLGDPKTVEAVSATNSQEKPSYTSVETIRTFASAFGAGVRLKSITMEMTEAPVTWGIDKWLPWLSQRDYLDGKTSGGGPELSSILHTGDFKTWR